MKLLIDAVWPVRYVRSIRQRGGTHMNREITITDVRKALAAFRGTREGFAKQYGVRHAKLAIQLWDANRAVALAHYWNAYGQISAAKAA